MQSAQLLYQKPMVTLNERVIHSGPPFVPYDVMVTCFLGFHHLLRVKDDVHDMIPPYQ